MDREVNVLLGSAGLREGCHGLLSHSEPTVLKMVQACHCLIHLVGPGRGEGGLPAQARASQCGITEMGLFPHLRIWKHESGYVSKLLCWSNPNRCVQEGCERTTLPVSIGANVHLHLPFQKPETLLTH